MTRAEIENLLALAEKATPGPWYVAGDSAHDTEHRDSGLALVDTGRDNDYSVARLCEWPNAKHIAACSPATVADLCRSLIAAEERAEGSAAEERASEEYSLRLKVEAREAVLRGAIDKSGRLISGAALHQMHEAAEKQARDGLHIMSAALASTGSEAADVLRAAEVWHRTKPRTDGTPCCMELDAAVAAYRAAHKERT